MHELAVAQGIVDRACEAAAEHGADRLEELHLRIGRATHVNPDQLVFCVETVTEGTPAEGATVTVEQTEPRGRCDCGWSGEPSTLSEVGVYAPDRTCPECGDRVELIAGRECRLASIHLPDENDGAATADDADGAATADGTATADGAEPADAPDGDRPDPPTEP
jgi:hydrogenase nickel incorporation protein HypA/HybF